MRPLRRFQSVYRTIDGRQFHGEIMNAPETIGSYDNFLTPRRILKVGPNAGLELGTTVVIAGRKYVLGDNGESEQYGAINYRSYKLFQVDKSLSWSRKVRGKDPVTGIEREYAPEDLGMIWCALEPLRSVVDDFNVPQNMYRLLTGADIQAGDLIDNRLSVHNVELLLGVRVAEVTA